LAVCTVKMWSRTRKARALNFDITCRCAVSRTLRPFLDNTAPAVHLTRGIRWPPDRFGLSGKDNIPSPCHESRPRHSDSCLGTLYCPIDLRSVHVDGLTTFWELWGSDDPLCCGVCRLSGLGSMYCRNDSLIAMSCLQPLLPRPVQRTKANSYRRRYCQMLGFIQFML